MGTGGYEGVILAAGHGSRMGPFGENVPKPIAPICNRPLLGYQLEHMHSLGIENVIVVIGHLGDRIRETLGDGSAYGVRLQYVEQKQRLGLAHAVGQLEPHIQHPFLLMLGDIYFEVSGLASMMETFEAKEAAAVLAVKEEHDAEAIKRNFSVILNDDDSVRRVIEKPRKVPNKLKGCGLYLFDDRIFEAVRRTPRTAMRDEYELTDSIQILIDYEYPVQVAAVVDWDINLTFVGDLIHCCSHELAKKGVTSLVGEGCSIAEGTELVNTVVGNHVTIEQPIRLEDCVVLDNAVLTTSDPLTRAVISPDAVLTDAT
jgi:NDP-sugar pyrophosphorylase family protein